MRDRRRVVTLLAAVSVAVATSVLVAVVFGLRLNTTPSEPLGLWRIVPLDRPAQVGDRLFVCLPRTATFEEARRRGYLRFGLCSGWTGPVIKQVAALGGAHITVGRSVAIDGVPLPNSTLRAHDGEGRVLAPFVGGVVPMGEVFLHSGFEGSYDSRYFGPVPLDGVLGRAVPLFTFDP